MESLSPTLPEIKEEDMCLCFEIKLCILIDISKHSKCENLDFKRLHLSYMGPILISLLNAIHIFQFCTSHMSNGCLPLFLVMILRLQIATWLQALLQLDFGDKGFYFKGLVIHIRNRWSKV